MSDSLMPRSAFLRGAAAIMPLSLATAPWGLLAGSMAIEANLTPLQGQGLSSIVFAGAAQLVAIGMLKGGAGIFSILLTTLLLTSQHLLYGMSMRSVISPLPGRWRIGLGFLLTDELFALTSQHDRQQFNRWYALGVGLTFYIAWNLFTLAGIVFGSSIPGLEHLGLDFSIAATFIALITPVVRNVPTVVCVAVSLFCSVLFSLLAVGFGAGAVGVGRNDRRVYLQQAVSGARMMVWAVIFGMGILVFLNRYVFLEPRLPVRLSSNARQFLGFAVPGMLTAICGPIVFMPDKQLNLQWDNPYLLSSLVAIALVIYTRNTLLSMLLSMAFFFLLRWWL
jgi:4-azaleucine resistance transporter AzlC